MDLVFLSLILLAFVVFFFILKRSKDRNLNLPPGPPRLPIIGNLHQMATGDPLPHRALRDLANQYGPLMYLQLGEVTTIVVSSPEYAKEVTTTHDLIFASRPHVPAAKILSYNYTDIAFAPYGPYWRQLRKICVMELLSPKTSPVFPTTFGNKTKDIELFQVVIAEATKMFAGSNIADMFPSITFLQSVTGLKAKIERMHQKTDRILTNIIDEHKVRRASGKSQKVEDLVDVLLNLQESGNLESPMTGENVKAVIMDVFSAGTETSATTVDWTMSELMRNPKVMKKAQAEVREVFNRRGKVDEAGLEEMQYLKLIIKETLRLRPSAPMLFPRECAETCNINGYDIPAKANVLVNVWAMTRDPKYWTEPDSYIPERFLDSSIDFKGTNYEYIPFGSGRRMCPGMTYASANIELPLAMLLYHFDWILPNGMKPEEMDMTEGFGVTVRRKQDLCLIPIPYQPSPVE
ncbi:Cytochrome P450 [Melia azedarach]|uniref:Cytochrome P450 n=1 Tax=Melia azedarach TaxID=155640 RepID=A0ACC1YNZ3_MELAZ|nr:Cytochrome P450 [Melia azedarach]